jgi:ABC-type transport system substrate-binding protein
MGKHVRTAVALAALVVVIAPGRSVLAGASTSPGSSTLGCPGDPPNQIYHPNSGGTPTSGGSLNVLGTSDVDDALDTNIGYTPVDSLAYMLYSRSLYTHPSVKCETFQLVPDLATGTPVISAGGLKYAVTIRTGALWDTSPPR